MAIDRKAAQEALERVKATQTEFWDALRDLETALGYDLDDDGRDYEGYTIDDFVHIDQLPDAGSKSRDGWVRDADGTV